MHRPGHFIALLSLATTRAFTTTSSHNFVGTNIKASSSTTLAMAAENVYSMADQEARFSKAKMEQNQRFLEIDSVYDPAFLKGKRVAITGANRGLGLALATAASEAGAQLIAIVRSTSDELVALNPAELILGIDATDDEETAKLSTKIQGGPIDFLINNAGYFKKEVEKLDTLDFQDELKTIDICAIGPLRVTASLINGGLLNEGSKVVVITSQGGSVTWRPTQCPEGGDYGHHVSHRIFLQHSIEMVAV